MHKQRFEVEFLDDIVLNSSSATTMVLSDTLDYIPGSAFLGMVAKYYKDFSDSFSVFHGGKVRFGDGHILNEGKYSYKVPFSYFINKGESLEEAKILFESRALYWSCIKGLYTFTFEINKEKRNCYNIC